ncbi:MAG: UDP-N-acetylmuramoyl-L-alanine--D-glutamate ligase [Candidatus Omnitrophota bacterium]|jgi:UDP-N-acetylmuramoylalanine--D-glutamate ligase
MDLSNKKVAVLGAAKSGLAAAALLCRKGARVYMSEQGGIEKFPPDFLSWARAEGVEIEAGGHTREFIAGSALVVTSPGVPYLAPPLVWAREQGIKIWGEIELAFQYCPLPVIAVTGSNGKTTVVTLITQVLNAAGKKAVLCGNVGTPFCDCVDKLADAEFVVLEVSSFQLETIEHFRPLIGVCLNFSQNHLDRHKDMEEYFAAKKRMFENQTPGDYAILNDQSELFKDAAKDFRSRVVFFNRPGDDRSGDGQNPNFLAVLAVSRTLGIPDDVALNVFRSFPGVEHRMEKVRILEGVEYINDSKATTVEAGRWALESLEKPVILICGGRDKHLDYSVLKDLVRKKVKLMIAMGEARDKFRQTFSGSVPFEVADTLSAAVDLARQRAGDGDCVLLSPMCASFDMFKNFEERGTVFKSLVRNFSGDSR